MGSDLRVCIQCLAAYNNGDLHFEWVDVPESVEELQAEIKRVLASSPVPNAEEHMFADYDHDTIMPPKFGEYTSPATLCEYVTALNAAPDSDAFAVAYAEFGQQGMDEVLKRAEDCIVREEGAFCDAWRDFTDELAEATVDGLKGWPTELARYFDYEAFSRDQEHNWKRVSAGRHLFIFPNHYGY